MVLGFASNSALFKEFLEFPSLPSLEPHVFTRDSDYRYSPAGSSSGCIAGVPGGGWGSGVIPFMGLESESDLHTYIPYIVIMQSN